MSESPAEAWPRRGRLHRARLGRRTSPHRTRPGELKYRPLVQWPFLIVLWRNLNGEKMTVKFEPADGGGTHVRLDGAVARAKQPLAADPGHWTDALDGSAT